MFEINDKVKPLIVYHKDLENSIGIVTNITKDKIEVKFHDNYVGYYKPEDLVKFDEKKYLIEFCAEKIKDFMELNYFLQTNYMNSFESDVFDKINESVEKIKQIIYKVKEK